jgi:hypothetical protein
VVRDQRIEIDAKLMSRSDGRIIAAAQRSGPVTCLRPIVERLGVALEREFLRPYYGRLRFRLSEPESVRLFLTPVLMDTALDEEKPAVERGATVVAGTNQDTVEPWATDPTTYTIEDILSGSYSLRLERPGYEGIGTENARWEARDAFGSLIVYDRASERPLEQLDPKLSRFVVRVDPLATETIDGDALGFSFRKLSGSIGVRIKRQYLDEDYVPSPRLRAMLIGDDDIELNRPDALGERTQDECDLFDERPPPLPRYGATHVAAGQAFDLETFKGGDLVFEDYRGATVPVGGYRMLLWEPHYRLGDLRVVVRDQDRDKPVSFSLVRETVPLTVTATGEQARSSLRLEGAVTHSRLDLPLDFAAPSVEKVLPVDDYAAKTDVPGLGGWTRRVDLLPKDVAPPVFDPDRKSDPPVLKAAMPSEPGERRRTLRVKTRLSVGGRLGLLGSRPDAKKSDVHVDREVDRLLDALLGPPWVGDQAGPKERTLASKIGRRLLEAVAPGLVPRPKASPPMSPGEPPRATSTATEHDRPATPPGTGPGWDQRSVEPPAVEPESLPRDPAELRELLSERLQEIDLLVLYDQDMERLLRRAEEAEVIRDYVDQGGAIFAFVSAVGDYQKILGAPLAIEDKPKNTDRFELSTGDVASIRLATAKKVRVASKRPLPRFENERVGSEWRVLAFSRGRKDPRIVERGFRDRGGYVLVWCDDPTAVRGRKREDMSAVEAARAEVAKRALVWARYLMYRRYDSSGEELRRAEHEL